LSQQEVVWVDLFIVKSARWQRLRLCCYTNFKKQGTKTNFFYFFKPFYEDEDDDTNNKKSCSHSSRYCSSYFSIYGNKQCCWIQTKRKWKKPNCLSFQNQQCWLLTKLSHFKSQQLISISPKNLKFSLVGRPDISVKYSFWLSYRPTAVVMHGPKISIWIVYGLKNCFWKVRTRY